MPLTGQKNGAKVFVVKENGNKNRMLKIFRPTDNTHVDRLTLKQSVILQRVGD